MTDSLGAKHFTESTAEIVAAYVKNNPVNVSDLPDIISTVGASLRGVTDGEPASEKPTPAVSVRSSVKKDHIVCLVCLQEKKIKSHLRVAHDLTPGDYKELFDLKPDYPLVAPSYAETRSKIAKKIGLGRSGRNRRESGHRPSNVWSWGQSRCTSKVAGMSLSKKSFERLGGA
jgi:predicted transcriptional regulator